MENYFNYFTEIEEHFQRRRGGILLLSTLDWALIETWKNAGVPLEAVLRGIDAAFDRYDQRPSKSKKVNSLAYCSQAVLAAAEDMKEAAVGATSEEKPRPQPGFEAVKSRRSCGAMPSNWRRRSCPNARDLPTGVLARESARSLREMAEEIEASGKLPRLEEPGAASAVLGGRDFSGADAADSG